MSMYRSFPRRSNAGVGAAPGRISAILITGFPTLRAISGKPGSATSESAPAAIQNRVKAKAELNLDNSRSSPPSGAAEFVARRSQISDRARQFLHTLVGAACSGRAQTSWDSLNPDNQLGRLNVRKNRSEHVASTCIAGCLLNKSQRGTAVLGRLHDKASESSSTNSSHRFCLPSMFSSSLPITNRSSSSLTAPKRSILSRI